MNNKNSLNEKWIALEEEIVQCRKCPRLVAWREEVSRTRRRAYQDWDYWGKPIPAFGDPQARVLVVGLAPAAHGGNRTGRAFTGDSSGDFLFRALYKAGFANQPTSIHRDDGLALSDLVISATCRCVPPANKPLAEEVSACMPYLEREIALMENLQGIVALGRIAFDAVIQLAQKGALGAARFENRPRLQFQHAAFYSLGESLPWLAASYHPSRQNTQTGRLTEAMFTEVWEKVRLRLEAA